MNAVQLERGARALSLSVDGVMPTSMMHFSGQDTMPLSATSEISFARLPQMELAMVIDSSLSMEGAKLANAKQAARGFVDDVLEPGSDRIRVSIVPFAEYLKISTEYEAEPWIRFSHTGLANRHRDNKWNGCVRQRRWPEVVSDSNYSTHPVRGWFGIANRCPSPVLPLSSEATALHAAIDAIEPDGGTYIPQGVLWGFRTLSPDAPYEEGHDFADFAASGGRKALVLLSDGGNSGSADWHGWIDPWVNGEEDQNTLDACNLAKDNGVHVYTIAYALEGSRAGLAKNLLRDCASTPDHFFDADNATGLNYALKAIANEFVGDVAVTS